ncbi:P-loop containing nucleoside triphosphate hydrolase protein, partial [Aureobasidium melanogenum]
LEYFSGIVFLTTNRIHVFDAAMKSRVHLALGYHEPSQDSRRQIWKQSLERQSQELLGSAGEAVDVDGAAELLSAENLNGREISNAIHTASTLARFAEEKLALRHIQEVLGVRRDFEATLEKMRKGTLEHASEGSSAVKRNSIIDRDD